MTAASRRLIVLGSTGSIGVNTLAVVEHLRETGGTRFEVIGLAARRNATLLREQAARFNVPTVALADDAASSGWSGNATLLSGQDAARELVERIARPGDLVVGAMVGAAGLPATLAAIERGCDVALANKETLVAAGAIVMPRIREKGIHLHPIDSEHSAIAQCLRSGRAPEEVRRVILTASGGPFRAWPAERIARASVDEALKHPTWSMGPKVTIDCASLMNKALEVIEAHWLFDLAPDRIEVLVHPQSIVHSLVEFIDGSVIAQLNPPDMRLAIQYALTEPARAPGCVPRLDLAALHRLEFEAVDRARFPALDLAYEAIRRGGSAGAILNAANEAAVEAFLAGRIPFGRVTELVREALEQVRIVAVSTLDGVMRADAEARAFVHAALEGDSAHPVDRDSPSAARIR